MQIFQNFIINWYFKKLLIFTYLFSFIEVLFSSVIYQGLQTPQACQCSSESFGRDVQTGILKSPNFPRSYCNNLRCVYDIMPKQGEAVRLIIEYFETEMDHDYMEVSQIVYDEEEGYQYVKQHVLSGETISQRHFYSSENGGLRLIFVTDSTENSYAGFQLSFYRFSKSGNTHIPCPNLILRAETQVKGLPEIGALFDSTASCVFQINSTEAVNLVVKNLSPSILLKIYETENFLTRRVSNPLESLNGFGSHNLPYELRSRTSSLTLVISFLSSVSRKTTDKIYGIEYKSAKSMCACPENEITIEDNKNYSYITPGFPLEYCDNSNCSTKFLIRITNPFEINNVSFNYVIRLKIESFDLENNVDYIEMCDQTTLLTLSEKAKNIRYFTFDHSQASLNFVTDHSVTEKGANFTVESYKKPFYCMCPGSPLVLQEEKHFQNHTFDEKCEFMDCFWELRLPLLENAIKTSTSVDSYRIILNVRYYLLGSEFIEVSNGQNVEKNSEVTRLETEMIGENGYGERNFEYEDLAYVSIWYHREAEEYNLVGERFIQLDYEWRKRCICGENKLEADSENWKELVSPDHPFVYCNNLNCEYQISAQIGERILLNITEFETEANQDYLSIFNGNSSQVRHAEQFSGTEIFENLIKSEGNIITILFTTDVSYTLNGYKILYKSEMTEEYERLKTNKWNKLKFSGIILLLMAFSVTIGTLVWRRWSSQGIPINRSFYQENDDGISVNSTPTNYSRPFSGSAPVRFIRNLRAESQLSLINPLFQSRTDN